MKKALFAATFLFIFLPFLPVYSQVPPVSGNDEMTLERRIQKRKMFSIDEVLLIQKETKTLSKDTRTELYEGYTINPLLIAGSFLLNCAVPGAGSMVLGDIGGGIFLLSGFTAGGAIFSIGFVPLVTKSYYEQNFQVNMVVAIAGGAIAGIFYLTGLVLPFTYSVAWHDRLRTGLRLSALPGTDARFTVRSDYQFDRKGKQADIDLTLAAIRF